jgi:putative glycosyltransferase (TIGR04372 family)
MLSVCGLTRRAVRRIARIDWKLAIAKALVRHLPIKIVILLTVTNINLRGRHGLAPLLAQLRGNDIREYAAALCANQMVRSSPHGVAQIFSWAHAHQAAVDLFSSGSIDDLSNGQLASYAHSLFELQKFAEIRKLFEHAPIWELPPFLQKAYAHSLLLEVGNEDAARILLQRVVADCPDDARPHQNLSSRDLRAYVPNELDYLAGGDGLLYDAYNYIGQRVMHVGAGHLSADLYGQALAAQERLRQSLPQLSPHLASRLRQWGTDVERIRLAPPEWAMQVGHLGLLDVLVRMRELGWWSGDLIVMAKQDGCANRPFLLLFEEFAHIVVEGENIGSQAFNELLSLQRYCGWSFNGWRFSNSEAMQWQDAGAMAMIEWERQGRGSPLGEAYSRARTAACLPERFAEVRAHWGMGPDDWFVCLHMRDNTYYKEPSGIGQSHRNATFEGYREAVEFVTAAGGWVVRLGGPEVAPLPEMPRVIDYARSPFKSATFDMELVANCRYFIGTTSGLTNLAISLGVPSALVNCITTDAQAWTKNVRFLLKPVFDAQGRMLTQRELTSAPYRWSVFNIENMQAAGLSAVNNTPEEILEVVKEVHAMVDGKAAKSADDEALIAAWRANLGCSYFYGAGQPARDFLVRYGHRFLV